MRVAITVSVAVALLTAWLVVVAVKRSDEQHTARRQSAAVAYDIRDCFIPAYWKTHHLWPRTLAGGAEYLRKLGYSKSAETWERTNPELVNVSTSQGKFSADVRLRSDHALTTHIEVETTAVQSYKGPAL